MKDSKKTGEKLPRVEHKRTFLEEKWDQFVSLSLRFFMGCVALLILFWVGNMVYNSYWDSTHSIKGWSFLAYDYRWSSVVAEDSGFKSKLECVQYGNIWLDRQKSEDALFTCSSGCKESREYPGMKICGNICEYGQTGLLRCRN